MSILSLSEYKQAQIEELCASSKAFHHYWNLLKQKTPQSFAEKIRVERHQAWMACALATYYKTATTAEVCLYWSQACQNILNLAGDELTKSFPALPPTALFAFGKLGAEELNLSSDVDILFIGADVTKESLQFARQFQALISDVTDFGFCFRIDYDLRPGGRQGPVVPTLDQFEDYYGNYGEAWERLAFVRFRQLWGDPGIITKAQAFAAKFSYRKHLDYSLLSDLQSLRKRIHEHYWHRSNGNQYDLKLGVGGIRDLELFVHALQVVHGGKDVKFRSHQTLQALERLDEAKVLPSEEVSFLKSHYWNLRHLENLVQLEADQQTHILTQDSTWQSQAGALAQELGRCDQIVSSLLGKVDAQPTSLPDGLEAQKQWLIESGFSPNVVEAHWQELVEATVLSRQKERDEQHRQRFLFIFIENLKKYSKNLNRSLLILKDFLKATRAKATFFSLLLNHENLIEHVAKIFTFSPYLSRILCSRPELLDSFVYRSLSSLDAKTDTETLLVALAEKKLLSELIAGTEFIADRDLTKLNSRLTETADDICKHLLQHLQNGAGTLNILCLGKWGGQELGLHSDLDFVIVTAQDPSESDLKIARRFLSRLTETNRGGSLYPVDLRLRPSDRGGLVVTSAEQLKEYLQNQAQAWERQAYLRARWLFDRPENFNVAEILVSRPLKQEDLTELERIRLELVKNAKSELDLKYAEGGFIDFELSLQAALLKHQIKNAPFSALKMLEKLAENISDWKAAEASLEQNYLLMRQVEQLHQISSFEAGSVLVKKSEGFQSVANLLEISEEALEQRIKDCLRDNILSLKRLDPRRTQD